MSRHERIDLDVRGTAPSVSLGLVCRSLTQYAGLVHACAQESRITQTEFTYAAPIYKGNDAIKAGLAVAESALMKFDVYFASAIMDETARVGFAAQFRKLYLQRFKGSERTDLFLASGDVMKIALEFVQPTDAASIAAIVNHPHDALVLAKIRKGDVVDRAHLRAEIKVFLDHALNPRRKDEAAVVRASEQLGTREPYVIEIVTSGALTGYLHHVIEPLAAGVGARLVLLSG